MIPPEILNYQIIRQIGSGGMGHVFLARNKNIEQYVAVKVLHPRFAGNPMLRQKFKQEAVLLSSLNHPNIVRFLNYVENEHGVFLIMEFVDGMTLEDFISKKNGLIVEKRAYPMIDEILDAFSYAHARNIVHLDIKPSNIFITRDGHIKIMDFGIAKIISESDPESNRQTMGTPEFMSPEQVLARPLDARSDIYSLGVLIHQMLTGRAPYDHTTLSQLEIKQHVINDALPKMKEYYPYVSDGMQKVVDKATQKLPDKRFRNCAEMRKAVKDVIDPEPVNRKLIFTWAAVGAILILGGLAAWDYLRVKTDYYADYTEQFGIPKGINSLSGREMRRRNVSYRMESSRRKPRRLTLVNSAGVPVRHTDTEKSSMRYTDVEYFYTDNGNIDYKKVYDEYGRLLFKLDYDENMKTATFKHDDEYGTPMRLEAETTNTHLDMNDGLRERSHITRHLLRFNEENGQLEEVRFAGLNNEPLGDSDNIYGQAYEYDSKGRITTLKFLGPDGKPRNNHIGLGIKTYAYDTDDNWTEARYYAMDGNPSHDGTNVSVVQIEYDKWGNRIAEHYRNADGTPAFRTDAKNFGFAYEYDDKGNRVRQTNLGLDGRPITSDKGIASVVSEYDERGNEIRVSYLDAEGNPCPYLNDGDAYYGIEASYTDRGLIARHTTLDKDGKPMSQPSSDIASVKWEYDTAGYPVRITFYGEDMKPAGYKHAHAGLVREYDQLHREIRTRFTDASGNPAQTNDHQWGYELEYDVAGNLARVTQLGKDGKIADVQGFLTIVENKYDERGNLIGKAYFNAKKEKAASYDGTHRIEYAYDPVTNMQTEARIYDTRNLTGSYHKEYDAGGNLKRDYSLDAGGRLKGNVENYEYDKYNRVVRYWTSRLDGTKTNQEGCAFSICTLKYDSRGNIIERAMLDAGGRPALDNMGTYRRVSEYDSLNRLVHELNYGKDGKPASGRNAYQEGRVEYDANGNMTVIAAYDGYGKPAIGADGYHKLTRKYNKANRVVCGEYTDTDGKLADARSTGYARFENQYDERGNAISEKYYKKTGKLDYEFRVKYNDRNQATEYLFLDAKGRQYDGTRMFSRLAVTYEEDGVTPRTRKFYNASGACLQTQRYNKQTDTWS